MANSLLDQLREQLEEVESQWLFFLGTVLILALLGALTLCGVYFYTRR